jgi:hypothetical protein
MILVTSGAGFISANFVLDWLTASDEPIINLDKLTYAANHETLASLQGDSRHLLVHGDIGDFSGGHLYREAKALPNGRCKNHGGMSNGPKTLKGRKAISEATRQRIAGAHARS